VAGRQQQAVAEGRCDGSALVVERQGEEGTPAQIQAMRQRENPGHFHAIRAASLSPATARTAVVDSILPRSPRGAEQPSCCSSAVAIQAPARSLKRHAAALVKRQHSAVVKAAEYARAGASRQAVVAGQQSPRPPPEKNPQPLIYTDDQSIVQHDVPATPAVARRALWR